jgi:cell wall-associated NlpC family hydrolase
MSSVDAQGGGVLARVVAAGAASLVVAATIGVVVLTSLFGASSSGAGCTSAGGFPRLPPGGGERVAATLYGGPGDSVSGSVGSSGVNLYQHPDSYAELGGTTFQTATALGGLAYETPLRITYGRHSVIAYKRDIGFGGPPIDGLPRDIDFWFELGEALRIPGAADDDWAGPVRVQPAPASGAGNALMQTPEPVTDTAPAASATACEQPGGATVPVTSGARAKLLPDGRAAAPASAPRAVQGIIAAGNQIVGKPYLYAGGHGLPLSEIAPSYDCSSSVEHLLYGGRLLPDDFDEASGYFETWGAPGPGRWVTIYASADHIFMYVAGLRWDTHNAAGAGDGTTGIGWHPLVRESEGFIVRHPVGL